MNADWQSSHLLGTEGDWRVALIRVHPLDPQ